MLQFTRAARVSSILAAKYKNLLSGVYKAILNVDVK
jgi:hypothetical protein